MRFVGRKSTKYGLILTSCGMLTQSIMASAHAERPVKSSEAVELLAADTPLILSNGTRIVAPKGWTRSTRGEALVIGAPESDSYVALSYNESDDADAAVAAAWASYRPGFVSAVKAESRPAREGWDTTLRYRYELPDGDLRSTLSLALKKGKGWTVLISDISTAVAKKRDSQVEILFNSLLPQGYARVDIPGVALGLIQDDKVIFAGGFGVRALERPEPVDAGTLFNIASVGKPLTTLMLAKQVEVGQFEWDTHVVSKWPTFGLGDAETTRKLQVKHFICACTGMPREDAPWLFEGDNLSAASTIEFLKKSPPTSGFGEIFQ
jgi:Beta-lactamase